MRDRSFVRVQDVILDTGGTRSSSPAWTRATAPSRGASVSASSPAGCRGAAATSSPGRTSTPSRCASRASTSSRRSPSSPNCTPPTSPTSSARSGRASAPPCSGALNAYLAADTLQEMDEELRAAALAEMPVARAAKVLEKLDADVAADLLADLPEDLAEELLTRQPDQRERDLRGLASHAEDTAGGAHDPRVRDAARGAPRPATRSPGCVASAPTSTRCRTSTCSTPRGGSSACSACASSSSPTPRRPWTTIMEDDLVTVAADTDEEEVGRLMTKYNLLAVPVVDDERRHARHRHARRRPRRDPPRGLEAPAPAPVPLRSGGGRDASDGLRPRRPGSTLSSSRLCRGAAITVARSSRYRATSPQTQTGRNPLPSSTSGWKRFAARR